MQTPVVTKMLPANRADLTHSGIKAEHGKPVGLPMGKRTVRGADGPAGRGRGKKRRPAGNQRDTG